MKLHSLFKFRDVIFCGASKESTMKYNVITEEELPKFLSEERSEISGYEFKEINLTDANLKSAVFIDCKFSNCNIANVSLLNVVLRGVLFENCNLMGINWSEVRKNGDYSFQGCKLDYGCFQSVDLRNAKLESCSIKEADFSGANLQKASFESSLLTGTSFANANLEKADFRNAKNYFIDPRFVKMKEAQFSFPEAIVLLQALGVLVEF